MAQAAEHLTPTYNWRLDEAFRHLTRSVRLSDSDALYEMEQLRVEVQKYIDGKPQGHPYYLHNNFRLHVRDHRWVIVEGLEGSDSRCRVAEQDVRAIQPAPSAGQPPLKPAKWLPLEHKRRQRLNDTPKDITTYAQQLHKAAVKAVGLRRLTNAPTARRIETLLHELDLFPKIQRRTKHARLNVYRVFRFSLAVLCRSRRTPASECRGPHDSESYDDQAARTHGTRS